MASAGVRPATRSAMVRAVTRAQRETDVLVPERIEQVGRRGDPADGG